MPKKRLSAVSRSEKLLTRIKLITDWVRKNQNWFYIAIIGFCLSVTILYKILQ
jgi:hypothetical protein